MSPAHLEFKNATSPALAFHRHKQTLPAVWGQHPWCQTVLQEKYFWTFAFCASLFWEKPKWAPSQPGFRFWLQYSLRRAFLNLGKWLGSLGHEVLRLLPRISCSIVLSAASRFVRAEWPEFSTVKLVLGLAAAVGPSSLSGSEAGMAMFLSCSEYAGSCSALFSFDPPAYPNSTKLASFSLGSKADSVVSFWSRVHRNIDCASFSTEGWAVNFARWLIFSPD